MARRSPMPCVTLLSTSASTMLFSMSTLRVAFREIAAVLMRTAPWRPMWFTDTSTAASCAAPWPAIKAARASAPATPMLHPRSPRYWRWLFASSACSSARAPCPPMGLCLSSSFSHFRAGKIADRTTAPCDRRRACERSTDLMCAVCCGSASTRSASGSTSLQKNLAVGRKACSEKRSATSTPEFGSVPYLRHSSMYLSTDAGA
mmetsp:Transcript_40535/g.95205  ORF Transcript_40535/g.95205 Transcript_40535/m.95205 type:complete len:204 (-) Transcript_40535:301-912(-)